MGSPVPRRAYITIGLMHRLFILSVLAALLLPAAPAAAMPVTSLTLLVNQSHPLQPRDYVPPNLVVPPVALEHPASIDPEMQLRAPAAAALSYMFQAAHQAGINLVLSSGYRSYTDQALLYASDLGQYGPAAAEMVAPPGTSEHQTGLAADIILSNFYCAAQGCFAITRAAAWLQANSYRYDFILRYPDYQQSSTGYEYEPWHYRYVGPVLATKLYRSGQTLEEYYGFR